MQCPVCHHHEFEEITPGEVRCCDCGTLLVLDRGWFYIKHALQAFIWIVTLAMMFFINMQYGIVFAIIAAVMIVLVDWKTDRYRIKLFEKKF